MELLFRTKEESNRDQEQSFLRLPETNRFISFLDLMAAHKQLPMLHSLPPAKDLLTIEIYGKMQDWKNEITAFLKIANKYNVRMILVGGGAVNFYGYQRHSADVDFWIETSEKNLRNLILVLNEMGYNVKEFPEAVLKQEKNISLKFSPHDLNLELITQFSLEKTFDEAYQESQKVKVEGMEAVKWNVLSYPDLIASKLKSQSNKDLLDIQELEKIRRKLDKD